MRKNFKSVAISGLTVALMALAVPIFTPRSTDASAAGPQQAASAAIVAAPQQSYADVVDRVAPAVVTIRSARRMHAPQQFPFFDDPFFRQFFGNPNRNRSQQDRSLVEHALGSGVIINGDGHILTNHHVIDGADQISVELTDRRSFEAKIIGSDDRRRTPPRSQRAALWRHQ